MVFNISTTKLLTDSRCKSRSHCVLTLSPLDLETEKALGPTNAFYLARFSDAVGIGDPVLKVSGKIG